MKGSNRKVYIYSYNIRCRIKVEQFGSINCYIYIYNIYIYIYIIRCRIKVERFGSFSTSILFFNGFIFSLQQNYFLRTFDIYFCLSINYYVL
jgi:hypothetical protein